MCKWRVSIFLNQSFSKAKLKGYDATESFIKSGKSFEGLKNVTLEAKNLFDIENGFDVTFCIGTFQIFHDIEKPLSKLLPDNKTWRTYFIKVFLINIILMLD